MLPKAIICYKNVNVSDAWLDGSVEDTVENETRESDIGL